MSDDIKTTILAPGPNGMVPIKKSIVAASWRVWVAALKELAHAN